MISIPRMMGLRSFNEKVKADFPHLIREQKGKNMDSIKPTRDPTEEVTKLEDTQHVSFLKMLGWRVVPVIEVDPQNPNQDPNTKRVDFLIKGSQEEIKKDLQRYYDNEAFPIQDFCRHLKDIKSQMYALRRMKK